ncbi:MAG: HAMP domain-containing histidine kinase, partial [Clostridia bacterium]|nr:HAMP domain-containing histidine kinase [Clostridia bacterium]
MIGGAVLLVLLSAVFFVLWQYFESPWLIVGYILAILAVCAVAFVRERRKNRRILDRFERILDGESADHIADEHLTPTERRLITRLCELETREAKVQNGYKNISSLVADIAHQSKTPLSSILMYTEMSEHDEIIRAQTEKLSFLIDRRKNQRIFDRFERILDGEIRPALDGGSGRQHSRQRREIFAMRQRDPDFRLR